MVKHEMTDWAAIRKEFEESNITLKDLAEKYGVKESTMRSRKNREGWQRNDETQRSNATHRKGGQRNNQNAKGNRGNPNAQPPPNNKNAVSHGLFANWLPDDTRAIIQELYTSEPVDILWNNIMIQYTAIIRSQKIMNVASQHDTTEWEKRRKGKWVPDENGNPIFVPDEIEKEIQFAWDKQANYLNAQSRAVSTLSNLIRQFVAIADESDERRLKLKLMGAQIENLNGGKDGAEVKDWKQAVIDAANKRVGDHDGK